MHQAPPLGEGLVEAVADWLQAHERARLVIVDTLGTVRGSARGAENAYAYDTREMTQLKQLADRHHVAVVAVHHKRKMTHSLVGEDVLDSINGTTGLAGKADAVVLLDGARFGSAAGPDANGERVGMRLTITGRDVPESQMHLRFQNGVWQRSGPMDEYATSPVVRALKAWFVKEVPGGEWVGATSELALALTRYGSGVGDARLTTGVLARFTADLEQRGGLRVQIFRNHAGRKVRITAVARQAANGQSPAGA